jgi:hypothetical protein
MNQHKSRQCCQLDELNNQSESTRGLASHQKGGVMRKLARIVTGVFQGFDSERRSYDQLKLINL